MIQPMDARGQPKVPFPPQICYLLETASIALVVKLCIWLELWQNSRVPRWLINISRSSALYLVLCNCWGASGTSWLLWYDGSACLFGPLERLAQSLVMLGWQKLSRFPFNWKIEWFFKKTKAALKRKELETRCKVPDGRLVLKRLFNT